MLLEFGVRLGRDKSPGYKKPAFCHIAQGFSLAVLEN